LSWESVVLVDQRDLILQASSLCVAADAKQQCIIHDPAQSRFAKHKLFYQRRCLERSAIETSSLTPRSKDEKLQFECRRHTKEDKQDQDQRYEVEDKHNLIKMLQIRVPARMLHVSESSHDDKTI
jgi:hypothetical protein